MNGSLLCVVGIVKLVRTVMVVPLCVVSIVKLVKAGMVVPLCVVSTVKQIRTGMVVRLCVVSIVKLVRTIMVSHVCSKHHEASKNISIYFFNFTQIKGNYSEYTKKKKKLKHTNLTAGQSVFTFIHNAN